MANRLYQIWSKFEGRSARELTDVGMDARAMPEVEEEWRPEELLPDNFTSPADEAMAQLKSITTDLQDKKGRRRAEKAMSAPPPVEAEAFDRQFEATDLRIRRRTMSYEDWLVSDRRKALEDARKPRKKFLGIF